MFVSLDCFCSINSKDGQTVLWKMLKNNFFNGLQNFRIIKNGNDILQVWAALNDNSKVKIAFLVALMHGCLISHIIIIVIKTSRSLES